MRSGTVLNIPDTNQLGFVPPHDPAQPQLPDYKPPSFTEKVVSKFWDIQSKLVDQLENQPEQGFIKIALKFSTANPKSCVDKFNFFTVEQEGYTRQCFEIALNLKKGEQHDSKNSIAKLALGNIVPGIIETLYHSIAIIGNVAKTLFYAIPAMVGYGNTRKEFKAALASSLSNFNQILRNAIRITPLFGHFLANLYDTAQLAAIDGTKFQDFIHTYRDYGRV